jgi:hypothetical protein
MPIPDSLQHQIELFRESGRVVVIGPNGFSELSLTSTLCGLGVIPKSYDPFVDMIDQDQLRGHLVSVRDSIERTVAAMPDHTHYIARHMAAAPVAGLAV